jgi:hypothetical protein
VKPLSAAVCALSRTAEKHLAEAIVSTVSLGRKAHVLSGIFEWRQLRLWSGWQLQRSSQLAGTGAQPPWVRKDRSVGGLNPLRGLLATASAEGETKQNGARRSKGLCTGAVFAGAKTKLTELRRLLNFGSDPRAAIMIPLKFEWQRRDRYAAQIG